MVGMTSRKEEAGNWVKSCSPSIFFLSVFCDLSCPNLFLVQCSYLSCIFNCLLFLNQEETTRGLSWSLKLWGSCGCEEGPGPRALALSPATYCALHTAGTTHVEGRRVQDPELWHYHQRHFVRFIQQVPHTWRGGGSRTPGSGTITSDILCASYSRYHTRGGEEGPGPRALALSPATYCALHTAGSTTVNGESRAPTLATSPAYHQQHILTLYRTPV